MAAAAMLAAFILAVNPASKEALGQTAPSTIIVVPIVPASPTPTPTPARTETLVPGCNNVVAPQSETVQQVAARVSPSSAVISIWKQIPGTTQFQGAAIGQNVPAGVSNLTSVNALDAIFICVNAAATYRIS